MSPWAGVGEVDGWPTVRSSDHRTLLAGHRGGDDDLDEEDSGTPLAVVILMIMTKYNKFVESIDLFKVAILVGKRPDKSG